jgi:hypothetical protein
MVPQKAEGIRISILLNEVKTGLQQNKIAAVPKTFKSSRFTASSVTHSILSTAFAPLPMPAQEK